MKNRLFLTFLTVLMLAVTSLTVLAQVDSQPMPNPEQNNPANQPATDVTKKGADNNAGYQLSLPENFPIKNFDPEFGDSNGKDDNNNGMVDECVKRLGTCMIIIYNTDNEPDDEFELRVDGQYEGRYINGKARFWDLMLPKGKHEVTVEVISNLDDSGNYSIMFDGCQKVKGPPTDMFNLTEMELYSWDVIVP